MSPPRPAAEIDVRDGDVRTVVVSGEVDMANVSELESSVLGDLSNRALGVVLDLTQTTYIDSAAVGQLYAARRRLARRSLALRVITRPGTHAHRVLELTGYFEGQEAPPSSRQEAEAAIRAQHSQSG
jgi:anti-anti-sigma factor